MFRRAQVARRGVRIVGVYHRDRCRHFVTFTTSAEQRTTMLRRKHVTFTYHEWTRM